MQHSPAYWVIFMHAHTHTTKIRKKSEEQRQRQQQRHKGVNILLGFERINSEKGTVSERHIDGKVDEKDDSTLSALFCFFFLLLLLDSA